MFLPTPSGGSTTIPVFWSWICSGLHHDQVHQEIWGRLTYFMSMTLGCFRGPLTQPKELLNHLGSLDMLGYMGNIVEGIINLPRSYYMVDLLIYIYISKYIYLGYIYILKLCRICIDLICPDKNVLNYNSSYHISVTYHSNGQATLSIAI